MSESRPTSRSGREIFEAIVLGKEWDFTDAEFESAVLDRQHTYPVLTQKAIDCASGATVDVEVSNILPINGSDFSGEIRNMLAALAHRIREINAPRSETQAWIPVNDQLRPEVGVNVLTFNDFDRCTYSAEWTGDSWSHFCGDGSPRYTIRNVTHWRKCPESPK